MALAEGTRLGPYEVISPLGAGGMGEVYRARDTRLKRDVAIKVLPDLFTSDPERLARFQREAELLATLNHPNIAQIYGLEDQALILELVEGPTLADRIANGPIAIDEALSIAKQIAEALEAAHERGIIHRDLKPGNIKLTLDGTVKVLDFGLAKSTDPTAGSRPPASGLSQSPTMTSPALMTGRNVILGTAAYMSPEQARGKLVDKRSDIWAFGCVLYEMLTGRRTFDGDDATEVLAHIITKEPEWTSLPPCTPPAISRLLRRSLAKERKRRLADMSDVRLELEEASSAPAGAMSGARSVRLYGLFAGVALASALLAAGATAWLVRPGAGTPATADALVGRLDLNLPSGVEFYVGSAQSMALSRDGTRVAIVGVLGGARRIYLRRLDAFDTALVPLRGNELVTGLCFSPDGRAVAFTTASGGELKTLSIADGLVVSLTTGVDFNSGVTWGEDNRITFAKAGAMWQIQSGGGTPIQVTSVDKAKGELAHRWPVAVGSQLLFTVVTGTGRDAGHIEALTGQAGERRVILKQARFPLYLRSGYLMFFRDNGFIVTQFDAARLAVGNSFIRALEDVAVDFTGAPLAAVSATGTLVYASRRSSMSDLVWTTRLGVEELVTDTPERFFNPRLSPDSRRIVVTHDSDLWLQELGRGPTKLTPNTATGSSFPVWTRDGASIVFRTVMTGLMSIETDGSNRSRTIPGTSVNDYPNSVAPDNTLAFIRISAERSADVYTLSLDGDPQPHAEVATRWYDGGPQISRDGHWLLYVSDKSGEFEVYLRPFRGPDREQQVSTHGGTQPRWNPNGKEVFYRDPNNPNKMMAVDVTLNASTWSMERGVPHVLFEQRYAFGSGVGTPNYDVSLDGNRFLMVKEQSDSGQLHVVLNWTEELKRLLPAK